MGLLALGGAISGMGQGLQQGLRTMQAGITQSGLAEEDRAFQMKKLQMQQDFEGQREQRSYAHSEKLQEQNQSFQTNLHEGDRQAASAEKEIDRVQSSIEKAKDRAQTTSEKDKDRTLQERKLGIEEAAQKSLDEYHKAVGSYYRDHKGRTGDPKAYKDLKDSTKALVEQHGKEADHYFKLAETELDERRKSGYIQSGKAALAKGYALLGEAPEPKAGSIAADDPFGTSPLSGKSGAAEPAPKSPGLLRQVPNEPAPAPKSYDQRVEEQLQDPRFDQLKRYFAQPSGPPVPPGPGVTLPHAQ